MPETMHATPGVTDTEADAAGGRVYNSFHHMQAVSVLCEGGNLADVIPAIASIDPVIGGVDR
jgi:NADH:ubiquinone oxidoreductase subunit D